MGGADGGGKNLGANPETDGFFVSLCDIYVSRDSQGAQSAGLYFHEYHCQYSGTWLGLYAGRVKGHGSAGGAGRGERESGVFGFRFCG